MIRLACNVLIGFACSDRMELASSVLMWLACNV